MNKQKAQCQRSEAIRITKEEAFKTCKKCGQPYLYLRHYGKQLGVFCFDCRKLQTWIFKCDIEVYESLDIRFEKDFIRH